MTIHKILTTALLTTAVLLGATACSAGESATDSSAKPSAKPSSSAAPAPAPAPGPGQVPPGGAPAELLTTALEAATVTLADGRGVTALVDDRGFSVYLLTDDSVADPQCNVPECLGFWSPVTGDLAALAVGEGISGEFAVWSHDGFEQLTINGFPLYSFGGDNSAGAAGGHGLNSNFGEGKWSIVAPDGTAVQ
ncbi:hypothetical protein [Homoserinimonas hongtaonis]|uniref:Lipoprotein n=1 Tax=Homoserinimonas hongtaonis TaxID=2079791 RepID=A0A2U1T1L4_9MICO|nr:hypothetical protein [Salinibacterium hongtaonis]PWB97764.1 hypothetical protein DF220_07930 [Salinibacterium hongtaonis]